MCNAPKEETHLLYGIVYLALSHIYDEYEVWNFSTMVLRSNGIQKGGSQPLLLKGLEEAKRRTGLLISSIVRQTNRSSLSRALDVSTDVHPLCAVHNTDELAMNVVSWMRNKGMKRRQNEKFRRLTFQTWVVYERKTCCSVTACWSKKISKKTKILVAGRRWMPRGERAKPSSHAFQIAMDWISLSSLWSTNYWPEVSFGIKSFSSHSIPTANSSHQSRGWIPLREDNFKINGIRMRNRKGSRIKYHPESLG